MKYLFLIVLMFYLAGCVQAENSNSQDQFLNNDGTVSGIFSQNCANCHAYHTQTEEQLIDLGLVLPGDPENSKIYYRLVGSAGSFGPKDMPVGGSLSPSELEQVRLWIENLN